MGIAKLYGQKASGTNINGIIKDYYAYAGENISAGDFVEYINGIASSRMETSSDIQLGSTIKHYAGNQIDAKELPNGNVFIAHNDSSGSKYLYGLIVTIDGTTIAAGTDILLMEYNQSGSTLSIEVLQDGNVFIAHNRGTGYDLYGTVCVINGTTITSYSSVNLSSSLTYPGRLDLATTLLEDGSVFIAHNSTTNYRLYGTVVTISGTSITIKTAATLLSVNYTSYYGVNCITLRNGNIFIAHCRETSYYLYAVAVKISGTTISVGTDTALREVTNSGTATAISEIDDNKIFVAHSYSTNTNLYGIVCMVSDTTITAGTDTQLRTDSLSGRYLSVFTYEKNKVFLAHSYTSYHLYAMICTVSGTTITAGTDVLLSDLQNSAISIDSFLLSNNLIFITHSCSSDLGFYLYTQILDVDSTNNIPTNNVTINEYETQVRKTTTSQFDGVAKTSGIGGDETGHNDLVSIYTL